jgi:hypothetical protein
MAVPGPAEGSDHPREVGAWIAEETVDAVADQRAQKSFGGNRRPVTESSRGHGHAIAGSIRRLTWFP